MTLVACVLVPHFPLAFELAAHPLLGALPVVIGGSPQEAKSVVDCSPEAAAEGVRPGLPLRQVLALCHDAVFLTARPAVYRERFTAMVSALERVSPVVEPAGLGECYVELQGVLDLYGGLQETAAALCRAVEESGVWSPEPGSAGKKPYRVRADLVSAHPSPRSLPEEDGSQGQPLKTQDSRLKTQLGIAAGKFPARAAALTAEPGRPRIITPEETSDFLAPLPVDLLPISEEIRSRLIRLGIATLGELAALPVTAVQAQFGPEGRRAWSLAGGLEQEPPRYQPPAETIAQAITLPAPTASTEALQIALRHLLAQAFARPERMGRGVRQVRLLLRLERDSHWERTVTLKEPAIEPQAAIRALRPVLEAALLNGAIEEVAVELLGFARESGRQEGLFAAKGRRLRQLEASLRQLKARYRKPVLSLVVEVEPWSRIPERQMALIDYDP